MISAATRRLTQWVWKTRGGREAENASIPAGWSGLPDAGQHVGLQAQCDAGALPHCTISTPDPGPRDRARPRRCRGATQPVHERVKGMAPLPQSGAELRAAHRVLPWQEYLHCFDHFGIVVELPACCRHDPTQ